MSVWGITDIQSYAFVKDDSNVMTCFMKFHTVIQSLYTSLVMRKDFAVQLNDLIMFESRYVFLFPQILLQVLPSCALDFICEH